MAQIICVSCGRPDDRSFYRGYRLADDVSTCCKAKIKRFKRGVDRYWMGSECSQHWPPVVGIDKRTRLERPDNCWRRHDYQCPICGAQFSATEWRVNDKALWPEEKIKTSSERPASHQSHCRAMSGFVCCCLKSPIKSENFI